MIYDRGKLMNVEQLKKANTNCFYIVITTIALGVVITIANIIINGFTIPKLIIVISALVLGLMAINGGFKHPTSSKGSLLIVGSATFFFAIYVLMSDKPISLSFALPILLCSIVYLDLKLCRYEMIVMSISFVVCLVKDIVITKNFDITWFFAVIILVLSFVACFFSIKSLNEFRSENNYYVSAGAEKTLKTGSDMADVAGNISSLIDKSKDNLFELTKLMEAQKFVLTDASRSIDSNTNVINVQTRRIQVVSDKESAITVANQDLESSSADIQRAVKESLTMVTDVKESYREVTQKSDLAAQKAKALMIKVESVKKLVDAFGGIAKQAELIALHASIEASKAGSEGSGLVAVANDIRAYGEKNASAASKISDIIAAFSVSVQDIINASDSSADSISKQSEMLDKVGYNLLGLENKVSDVLSNYNNAHQEIESFLSSSSEIKDSIGSLSSANSKAAALLQQSFDTTDQADEKFNEFKTILGDVFSEANTLIDLHEKAMSQAEF
ncbi:MAG: methyl-accepting chemotaxis protein [Butyrivibrio sp.]|nr:methyl-accepting chemotaxis protein [Butyrivibrio sp.]